MGSVMRRGAIVPGLRLALFTGVSLAVHAAALGTSLRHRDEPAKAPVALSPSPAALVGDTLDVEPEAPAIDVDPEPAASPSPGQVASPAPGPTPATAPGPGPGKSAHPGAPGAAAPASAPPVFGAVGVRYATDLATTFTRGFPQAASDAAARTDPDTARRAKFLQSNALAGGKNVIDGDAAIPPFPRSEFADCFPEIFGPAGTATVMLTIDDAGHLTSSSIGGSPSPALRRGIERTLVLLGGRTFTARGAVTKLRVTARVSPNDVHDGLHGDVFALSGGSFAGDVGTAFFALPGSAARRVDVELRLLP